MGLVEVEQVLVEASVDMAMDQDVEIMADLMATTEDLVATTASIMEIMEASIMGTMGASIMEAVFPTADMDRIVILATTANTTMVITTMANTTTVSSLGPWPVSSMEGRHQRRRIV